MEKEQIYQAVDHTLLRPTAAWSEVAQLCDEAIAANAASVCIPPSYVRRVKEYVQDRIPICTVIGFPNGYQTTFVKQAEAKDAIANGADEIDMVINLGDVKNGAFQNISHEISAIKATCGSRILKVIIETCYLTKEEKIQLCGIVTACQADYIKTSTGFGSAGAALTDIQLFQKHIGSDVKIKAAGGIGDLKTAEEYLTQGASRLGSSAILRGEAYGH